MKTKEQLFNAHQKNLRAIEKAIKHVELAIKNHIRLEQSSQVKSFTRVLSLLVSMWADVNLQKIVHSPNAFSQVEIDYILDKSKLTDKWLTTLDIGFQHAYNLKEVTEEKLKHTPRSRYISLRKLINEELASSLEERNRLAHGQWERAFTSDLKDFSSDLTKRIINDNVLEIRYRHTLLKILAKIVLDLAVSPSTFERDFDDNYYKLERKRDKNNLLDYKTYNQTLKNKARRGNIKRSKT